MEKMIERIDTLEIKMREIINTPRSSRATTRASGPPGSGTKARTDATRPARRSRR